MEFAGIITEYDPFHNGHAAQIAAAKSAGAGCVAVCMSSGAVQRGGVPVLPESVRVCAALDAGADLVITLPAPCACATAEQFASAGVRLLAALGCDTLVFGAGTPTPPSSRKWPSCWPGRAGRPITGTAFHRHDLRRRTGRSRRRATARGQGHCCARPTTFWASSTAKPFWRRVPPSRRWRCPGWVQPTAAADRGAQWHPHGQRQLPAQPDGGGLGTPTCPLGRQRCTPEAAAAGLLADGSKFEVAVLALLRAKPEADFAAVRR